MDQPAPNSAPRLIDIYACYDLLEAARAKSLLESRGIECRLIDLAISPLPLTIGKFGEKRLSVPHEAVIEAKQLLGTAIQDGYLSADGRFYGAQADRRESA
jgi:hypothetical protein